VSALVESVAAGWTVESSGYGRSLAWWLRSALSLALAVAILAVAIPAAFGSRGDGAGVDPVQVFSSGSLITVETSGGGQLSIDGMVPGQSRSATIRVSNGGSAAAPFSLAARIADRVGSGGAPLSAALVLRIEPVGSGAPIYSGPVGKMPRLGLGSIPAGAERAYRFIATLPDSVGNAVAGSALSASFAWNAA
jgi:hypothetical protein